MSPRLYTARYVSQEPNEILRPQRLTQDFEYGRGVESVEERGDEGEIAHL